MKLQHYIALLTTGCFFVLASYSYGRYHHEEMVTVWANSDAEQLAGVWALKPDEVSEPVEIFRKVK